MSDREELLRLYQLAEEHGDQELVVSTLQRVEQLDAQAPPEPQRGPIAALREQRQHQAINQPEGQMWQPLTDLQKPLAERLPEVTRVVQPAATMATAIAAEPVAGLAGIAQTMNPFASPGAGARAVESTREALTYQPRTQAGQEGLQAVAESWPVKTIGEAIGGAETGLGNKALEETGSPAVATAAHMIPSVVLTALGGPVAGAAGKVVKSRAVNKMMVSAAPEIKQIESTASKIYKEIDDLGVKIKPGHYKKLVNKISVSAKKLSAHKKLTKMSHSILKDIQKDTLDAKAKGIPDGRLGSRLYYLLDAKAKGRGKAKAKAVSLLELDQLRKSAGIAVADGKSADKNVARMIRDNIDEFMNNAPPSAFIGPPQNVKNIQKRYAVARKLWGQARRSELLNEAMYLAKEGLAAGNSFESGIKSQFKALLRNKKTRRYFKPDEIAAMSKITKGTAAGGTAKLLSHLGFNDPSVFSILKGGGGAYVAAKAGGAPLAVAAFLAGRGGKAFSERLAKNQAAFADAVVRAGDNGKKITEIYMKHTPKADRSSKELSQLLMRPSVEIEALLKSQSQFVKDASKAALAGRASGAGVASIEPDSP